MRLYLPSPIRDSVLGAVSRLEISFDVQLSVKRLKRYGWEWKRDWEYAAMMLVSFLKPSLEPPPSQIAHSIDSTAARLWRGGTGSEVDVCSPTAVVWVFLQIALFSLSVMAQPLAFKVFLVAVYTLALLIPFTSQFFLPASPIFSWLILFYSSQFIPKSYRPHIWVSVLPTLESVLYGANISDLLTRWTNPFLDIMAWLPYGLAHFAIPFVVAALLFIFSPPGAVKFFASAFGYMNLVGVMIQIAFPCAPPCEPCPFARE